MHGRSRPGAPRRVAAFTLVELLAVLAIVAVLAGVLYPSLTATRSSALRTRTKLQFHQWTAAMEQFRQEYGYYPAVGTDGRLATAADALGFIRALSGCNPDGSAVADPADLNGNLKRIAFCAFGSDVLCDPGRPGPPPDFSGDELVCDAFGNTEIGVLVDRNGDGVIKPADDGPVASITGARGVALIPTDEDLPAGGVRAGVLFYSAGRGGVPADLVLSWK